MRVITVFRRREDVLGNIVRIRISISFIPRAVHADQHLCQPFTGAIFADGHAMFAEHFFHTCLGHLIDGAAIDHIDRLSQRGGLIGHRQALRRRIDLIRFRHRVL